LTELLLQNGTWKKREKGRPKNDKKGESRDSGGRGKDEETLVEGVVLKIKGLRKRRCVFFFVEAQKETLGRKRVRGENRGGKKNVKRGRESDPLQNS